MKVLIVEDNPVMSRNLLKGLEEAGWTVDTAFDGEEGLYFVQNGTYDVIAIDWMLPKLPGIELLQKIRDAGNTTPVIMLTARGALGDRVQGLQVGADDYLVKPFELAELLARLLALFRRSKGRASSNFTLGKLYFDLDRREIFKNQVKLELTRMEFDLLLALAHHFDQLMKRSDLTSLLYKSNDEPEGNSLDVILTRLRKKITGSDLEIATIRGKGLILRVAQNPA